MVNTSSLNLSPSSLSSPSAHLYVQMSQDPNPQQPLKDLTNIPYFSSNWHNLSWSPWVPFSAAKEEFRFIPKDPDLYRIRPAGKEFLMYIGETRRTVHQRINWLRQWHIGMALWIMQAPGSITVCERLHKYWKLYDDDLHQMWGPSLQVTCMK